MLNKSLFLILILFISIGSLKAQDVTPTPSPEVTEQIILPSPTETPLQEESPTPSLSPEESPIPSLTPSPSPTITPIKEITPELPQIPIPSPPNIPSPPPLPEFPKMPEIPKTPKPQIKKPYKKIDFNKLPLPEFAD